MKLYGEISKTEELDDGTIKVWGYASSESVDSDGETITSDAMKGALADYMKFGAVREMHQPKAAGTAIEANVQDDGKTYFGAHVVDSEAVKKVKAGVYKGFSIGGKVTERDELNKTIIKGIKLVEVSLVDRPANPEAVFTCYKAEALDEQPKAIDELADMLNKGLITPEKLIELAKGASFSEAKPEVIEKGMYSICDFASVLSSLQWICMDAQSEADWEGDSSPVPAQLRTWLSDGVKIFTSMAVEETSEMLASLKTQAGEIEIIEMAAKGGNLHKAGAKFSADTAALIQEAHDSVKKADEVLSKLGYDTPGDNQADKEGEQTTDDVGVKTALSADLTKVSDQLDLTKSDLAKVAAERDTLQKRVKELEAMPAPGRAFLKAVGKDQDIGETVVEADPVSKVEPVKDASGDINDVATMIKSIHRGVGASRV